MEAKLPDQDTIVEEVFGERWLCALCIVGERASEARAKSWLLCRYKWADKETFEEYFCWVTLKLKCMVLILSLMTKTMFML